MTTRTFDPIRENLASRQRQVAPIFSREMERRLKDASPKRTRELERSISVKVVTSVGRLPVPELRIEAVAEAPQAEWTEKGTKPHRIVGNPTLAFFWEKAGRFVFFHSVNHPGNPARPWFAPTLAQTSELFRKLWQRL